MDWLLSPRDSPGKNTGVGCHSLLQGIFPTQGSNPRLLLGRWVLHHWATREPWGCSLIIVLYNLEPFFRHHLYVLDMFRESRSVVSQGSPPSGSSGDSCGWIQEMELWAGPPSGDTCLHVSCYQCGMSVGHLTSGDSIPFCKQHLPGVSQPSSISLELISILRGGAVWGWSTPLSASCSLTGFNTLYKLLTSWLLLYSLAGHSSME